MAFDPSSYFQGAARPSISGGQLGGWGSMDTEKQRAPWVPALIEPPDPFAPLEEWQSYRADLDALEIRLLVSHPDLDWLDGIRAFKAEADAVIRQMTRRGR